MQLAGLWSPSYIGLGMSHRLLQCEMISSQGLLNNCMIFCLFMGWFVLFVCLLLYLLYVKFLYFGQCQEGILEIREESDL